MTDSSQIKIPGKICVSIACKTTREAITAAKESENNADVLEIRLDALSDPEIQSFTSALQKPLLFTCRAKWEGGLFSGTEDERIGLLQDAVRANAAYVDIELKTDPKLYMQLLSEVKNSPTCIIVSWHNFEETPPEDVLSSIFNQQLQSNAHIGKIVTLAHDFSDVLRVLNLQGLALKNNFPLIAFCMGEMGMISRLSTLEVGGYMTYAAPDKGRETAPGQLSVSAMRKILRRYPGAY